MSCPSAGVEAIDLRAVWAHRSGIPRREIHRRFHRTLAGHQLLRAGRSRVNSVCGHRAPSVTRHRIQRCRTSMSVESCDLPSVQLNEGVLAAVHCATHLRQRGAIEGRHQTGKVGGRVSISKRRISLGAFPEWIWPQGWLSMGAPENVLGTGDPGWSRWPED
jgi:hypothetical protein